MLAYPIATVTTFLSLGAWEVSQPHLQSCMSAPLSPAGRQPMASSAEAQPFHMPPRSVPSFTA